MDEILELQRQLEEAQENEPSIFPEKTCILVLLQAMGLSKKRFIRSTDGLTFFSQNALFEFIAGFVEERGGKIDETDLCSLLDIDKNDFVNVLRNDMPENLLRMQSSLVSKQYMALMGSELSKKLERNGYLDLSTEEQSLCFSMNSLERFVFQNTPMDQVARSHSKIFSGSFLKRQQARWKGLLNGIVTPVNLEVMLSLYDLEPSLSHQILKGLQQEVSGSFSSRHMHSFSPEIWRIAQRYHALSFFNNNGYISFRRLSDVGLKAEDFLEFLEDGKALKLNSLFLSHHMFFDAILESLVVGIQDQPWLDFNGLCPEFLKDADSALVFEKACSAISKRELDNCQLLLNRFVVKRSCLEDCFEFVSRKIHQSLEERELLKNSKEDTESLYLFGQTQIEEEILKTRLRFPKDLGAAVASLLFFRVQKHVDQLKKRTFKENSFFVDWPKESIESIAHAIKLAHVFEKSIQIVHKAHSQKKKTIGKFEESLHIYFLETIGTHLVNLIKNLLSLVSHTDLDELLKNALEKALKGAEGKSATLFIMHFEYLLSVMGIKLLIFEKLEFRRMVFGMKKSLQEQALQIDQSNISQLIQITLVVLFAQKYGSILHLPDHCSKELLNFLRDDITGDSYAALHNTIPPERLGQIPLHRFEFIISISQNPKSNLL